MPLAYRVLTRQSDRHSARAPSCLDSGARWTSGRTRRACCVAPQPGDKERTKAEMRCRRVWGLTASSMGCSRGRREGSVLLWNASKRLSSGSMIPLEKSFWEQTRTLDLEVAGGTRCRSPREPVHGNRFPRPPRASGDPRAPTPTAVADAGARRQPASDGP